MAHQQVTLREITAETRPVITDLGVSPAQQAYVAANAVSIAEAEGNPGAWYRAVYAGAQPVGFVMLFDPAAPGAILKGPIERTDMGLWRLMIDRRFQGRGFGRQTLNLIVDHVQARGGFRRLLTGHVPGPDGPEGFYLSAGFSKTGRLRNDGKEIEIVLALEQIQAEGH